MCPFLANITLTMKTTVELCSTFIVDPDIQIQTKWEQVTPTMAN